MDDYTPTTKEVERACVRSIGPARFYAWLTAHDAEIAAKAWSEGWSARASRGYAHLKVGECVPPPAHINPYREAVQL